MPTGTDLAVKLFIGLGGVNFAFLQVSRKFISTFPMLPNPIPYSESESVLLWQRVFLFASSFLIAFSSLSIFLHNCKTDCFVGLGFLHLSWLLGSQISCFHSSRTYDNLVCCAWYVHPHVSCTGLSASRNELLRNPVSRLCTGSLVSFLIFCRSFLGGLCTGSFLGTYALNSLKELKKQMHVHEIQRMWLARSALGKAIFMGIMPAFMLGL